MPLYSNPDSANSDKVWMKGPANSTSAPKLANWVELFVWVDKLV